MTAEEYIKQIIADLMVTTAVLRAEKDDLTQHLGLVSQRLEQAEKEIERLRTMVPPVYGATIISREGHVPASS